MRLASCWCEPLDHPSLRARRRGHATDVAAGTDWARAPTRVRSVLTETDFRQTGARTSLTNICGQFTPS
jgi:hypothetical protein